ncbi:MAG: DJ-1/PfpI family protein [Candidatus Diapherotrites archaeon]|uniref:DJ-1/PfpI family protein n=1 Tax=Candidatus Iainarchaeum sp. TaxID=3101447 RepID=A0A8T4KRH7_9ARCH|nr:DJ-1/PfpI family protein [Candidatus Diapherotrites archaeon]
MSGSKKALIVIAFSNFRDEELFDTQAELEKAGIETTVASIKTGIAKGMLGGETQVQTTIEDADSKDYDAVVFIGGGGASVYFNNKRAHEIASSACNSGKILAAICIAPSTLANAGLLKGKKATCFPSEAQNLKSKGAIYTGKAVETDGKIITADGPESAHAFGKAIANALK